ncbi:synaptic vesicle glycoprotein 2A [Diachasma alloeum]|uniref:synaptic vesicle glycoprotein 2A n=1 Tax=Diachasma alloeum TaxID=454923 RepID=UPI0007382C06|nr:synaptic vesicle glycoprotein 2A [Diachasma alloeum]
MQIEGVVNDRVDIQTVETDVETAVTFTGFGKFNIKILVVCGLIYMNTGFSISSVGLILPSAACDFQLTTIDKGRISATPTLGMIIGAYFWGCFADLAGRRKALLTSTVSYALCEIVSSVVSNYWGFLLLKFFSGFSISGHSTVVFTYLGEFQSGKIRERMLCWMEMAWSLGLIALPLTGWAIIPIHISIVNDVFFFRSWNLFVIVCALPSVFIGFWLLSFPESPKYLAESGNNYKLTETLRMMHVENTGKPFEDYLETLSKNGYEQLSLKLRNYQEETAPKSSGIQVNRARQLLRNIYQQTLTLMKPPLLRKTANVCSIMFCLGSSYYALMLWFPELFQRFARFENESPADSASVCSVSEQRFSKDEMSDDCPTTVPRNVYVHTLILGIACVPLSVLLPLCVDKLGYKFYLVVSTLVAASVTLGLLFVKSSIENLILSCIFEAASSIGMSIVLAIIVDLFPTNLRAIAAALCAFCGRLGALVGNYMFGYLIDTHCLILIIIVAVKLLVSSLLGYLLPIRRHPETTVVSPKVIT